MEKHSVRLALGESDGAGIEWAMGGMWLIVLGVAYAFIFKPLFFARRNP